MRHAAVLIAVLLAGCFASRDEAMGRVALISNGHLENRDLSKIVAGPWLEGESCKANSLSTAFADAIDGTRYDTLVDVQIGARDEYSFSLPFFVLDVLGGGSSASKQTDCVYVRGRGVDSTVLPYKAAAP